MPRRLLHPKKRTVGVRIPDHTFVQALLETLGEPLLTSTLILPGETEPRTSGWEIKEELDHQVDIVVEAGETPAEPTTVDRLVGGLPRDRARAAPATRPGSRPGLSGRVERPGAGRRAQARQSSVADDQRAAVVGEPGDDGLDDAVAAGAAITSGRVSAEQREDPDHHQRRQHADGEEVARPDRQRQADAEQRRSRGRRTG